MSVSNIRAIFNKDIQLVWETVTSLENYAWRSDLSRIEIQNERVFMEYTKGGFPTRFTITALEPMRRYEFDMENANMTGHWIGIFSSDGSNTAVDFTEIVTARKFWMKPFVRAYLKKQQTAYIQDLTEYLK